MFTSQLLDGRHDLEPQESVRVVHQVDQDVHGGLTRNPGQRGWNMSPYPDVFFGVREEVLEDVDDAWTVPDERLTSTALEPSIPEQRNQRRREDEVGSAE